MIVVTYTPNESGPVLEKSLTVLSEKFPIQILDVGVAENATELRKLFNQKKFSYKIEYLNIQDHHAQISESIAYRLAAVLVLEGCSRTSISIDGPQSCAVLEFVYDSEAFAVEVERASFRWRGNHASAHINSIIADVINMVAEETLSAAEWREQTWANSPTDDLGSQKAKGK